jgi:hypothetical protein
MKYSVGCYLSVAVLAVTAGCAQINVQHLDPTAQRPDGPAGIRYYLPKPYLIVTLLPPDPSVSTQTSPPQNPAPQSPTPLNPTPAPPVEPDAGPAHGALAPEPGPAASAGGGHALPKAGAGGGGGGGGAGKAQGGDGSTTTTTATSNGSAGSEASGASGSDTSFMASTSQYVVKLVYLPDYAHPVTITVTAGLFGTAAAQPALQDGWMLTGLQANVDNSQLPQMLGTIVTALAGSGKTAASAGGGGGGKLPNAGGAAPALGALASVLTSQMLEPGLYEFTKDSLGTINGVCLAQPFGFTRYPGKPPGLCRVETLRAPRG